MRFQWIFNGIFSENNKFGNGLNRLDETTSISVVTVPFCYSKSTISTMLKRESLIMYHRDTLYTKSHSLMHRGTICLLEMEENIISDMLFPSRMCSDNCHSMTMSVVLDKTLP